VSATSDTTQVPWAAVVDATGELRDALLLLYELSGPGKPRSDCTSAELWARVAYHHVHTVMGRLVAVGATAKTGESR
jgi:hypothetical protein